MKNLKRITVAGCAIAAFSLMSLNCDKPVKQDNVSKIEKEIPKIEKEINIKTVERYVDNVFGYTEECGEDYTHYTHHKGSDFIEDEISCYRSIDLTYKLISDGGYKWKNDGLVDKLVVSHDEQGAYVLIRKRDYEKHKKEFGEADKFLAEIKERAMEYGYPSKE